jgi:hypothetical protein
MMFSVTVSGSTQHFMLENHANAFFDGILRARNFYHLVLDTNFPFIRLIKARQHIHERGFARAIFIRGNMNFTSFQGKLTRSFVRTPGKRLVIPVARKASAYLCS